MGQENWRAREAWRKMIQQEVDLLAERIQGELKVPIQVVKSFAQPRVGTQFAIRLTVQQPAVKKLPPITLWSGIVSERTFARPRDARKGIVGLAMLGFERKGVKR